MASFEPFSGYSAWFSVSVEPSIVEQWGNYGGHYGSQRSADFLFSESATTEDTQKIYANTVSVSVFRPEWITKVIESKEGVANIPIARYILLPAHCTSPLAPGLTLPSTPPKPQPKVDDYLLPSPTSKVNNTALKDRATINTASVRKCVFNPSAKVEFLTSERYIKDIVHVDDLGTITERLVDATPNRNGLIVTGI